MTTATEDVVTVKNFTEDDFREIACFLQDNDPEALTRYCTEKGIDLSNSQDETGHTLFTRIMIFPNTATKFAKMLYKLGANPNIQNAGGNTPLHVACMHGSAVAIDYLIGKNVDLNTTNNDGETPLRVACTTGHGYDSLMQKESYM